MPAIVAALLSTLSSAALAVIAKLISQPMFERLLERLIVAGVDRLAEETASPLLHDVAKIVRERLENGQGSHAEAAPRDKNRS